MKIDKFFQYSYVYKNKSIFGAKCGGVCTGLSLAWIEANIEHKGFKQYAKQTPIKHKVAQWQEQYSRNKICINSSLGQDVDAFIMITGDEDLLRQWGDMVGYRLTRMEGGSGGPGKERKNMLAQLTWSMISRNVGMVYGIIRLMPKDGNGHCLAWTQLDKVYSFFDANFGIYSGITEVKLPGFISSHLKRYYKDLNYTWTTAKFSKIYTTQPLLTP
ncbi:C58 family peptidase [Scandinavium sp. TWS1a]|uniref:C58 family peptidase n=1 Tax=Scandinavium tedordense TaxID=2926521 RepID=UPI002164FBB1|nr:C58 family peptidase [Scandinavium tedordense]MCS2170804.1 C58 family peptidase [Scandinavium tedordense]